MTSRDRFGFVVWNLIAAILLVVGTGSVSGQTNLQYDFTTFLGYPSTTGTNDGLGTAARFSNPWTVAVDTNGNIFIADQWNGTIRKATPAGQV